MKIRNSYKFFLGLIIAASLPVIVRAIDASLQETYCESTEFYHGERYSIAAKKSYEMADFWNWIPKYLQIVLDLE